MPAINLVKKLLIKPGQRALVLNPPAGYPAALGPLPEGAVLAASAGEGPAVDCVLLFVRDRAELARLGPAAVQAAEDDGLLWIAYPKQSSRVPTDITRDRGWDPITSAGLRPVTQVAIDDIWSALRFRPSERVRRT